MVVVDGERSAARSASTVLAAERTGASALRTAWAYVCSAWRSAWRAARRAASHAELVPVVLVDETLEVETLEVVELDVVELDVVEVELVGVDELDVVSVAAKPVE